MLQGAAGEAVVIDDDEEEAADGPDPEPLAFPDALPIALVDESLPVSESPVCSLHSGARAYLVLTATTLMAVTEPPASRLFTFLPDFACE